MLVGVTVGVDVIVGVGVGSIQGCVSKTQPSAML